MAMLDDRGSTGAGNPGPSTTRPLLYEGQRLDQPTFHALYERMPEDFQAELIDGVVYLTNMPLLVDHARPDALMVGLLFSYSIETPGTKVFTGLSTKLSLKSEVQPDSCLFIHPDFGGRAALDAKGMLVGAPELVVEIGSSTLKRDLAAKKRVYEQAGALEYVVYGAKKREFHWFALRDGKFVPMPADPDGVFRSGALPGFWIDREAFIHDDGPATMATLRRGLASPEHADFVEQLRRNRANRP